MTDPYTLGHVTDAHIAADTFAVRGGHQAERAATLRDMRRMKVPIRSEHSCKNQTSQRGREKDHPSHRSKSDSSSSSGSHRERHRKRAEEVSEHHRPAHQYQVEGSPHCPRSIMCLDTYDGSTDPQEHIQNVRGSLELLIHDNDVMCKILPTTFRGNKRNEEAFGSRIPQTVLKKDPSQDGERNEARQQGPVLPEILIILGGSTTNVGVARNKRTRVRDQVLVAVNQERFWNEPITFTPTDGQRIEYPHEDALVISPVMEGHRVYKILMDNDSSVNILSTEAMMKMGIDASRMTPVPTPFIGI
uniref:Uncharacterized protein n=1 Tax=Populus trichocarpa TaxID=3694 RepID=A0A2K2CAH6_POPTR